MLKSTNASGRLQYSLASITTYALENVKFTMKTKISVYKGFIISSTLLRGSEAWTKYAKEEKKLNSFHLCCLCHILAISWRDKLPTSEVLSAAGLPTMYPHS